MKNIFENTYVGKPYKTRDGSKAIYLGKYLKYDSIYVYILILEHRPFPEGWNQFGRYENTGIYYQNERLPEDIVSEWQE